MTISRGSAASRDKAALRRHYRRVRRQHAAGLQQQLDHHLSDFLEPLLRDQRRSSDRHVGVFWPLNGEPNLGPALRGLGWSLALPAVAAGRLLYRPWPIGTVLQPDDCDIPAPAAELPALAPVQLVLLLVPALAVDRGGVRLGYGGGWYDRLRADPAWRAVPAVVIVPEACVVDTLPGDPWDIPFDGWIDEGGLRRPQT